MFAKDSPNRQLYLGISSIIHKHIHLRIELDTKKVHDYNETEYYKTKYILENTRHLSGFAIVNEEQDQHT